MRIERDGEVALIRLENGKANAIGPSFLDRLESLLGQLGDARAAAITGQGSAFSAGLDLPALVDLDRVRMRAFVLRFETAMMRVFELPIPLVAAVNGHAVAGGGAGGAATGARHRAGSGGPIRAEREQGRGRAAPPRGGKRRP